MCIAQNNRKKVNMQMPADASNKQCTLICLDCMSLHWDRVNLATDNRNNVALKFPSSRICPNHVLFSCYFYIYGNCFLSEQYPITEESNDAQKALISCRHKIK